MAPEMILRKGYGKAVDWWSMGALVYEMTAGYPPFQGKTPKDLNRKILNERVSLPKWLSPTAHQVGFVKVSNENRITMSFPWILLRHPILCDESTPGGRNAWRICCGTRLRLIVIEKERKRYCSIFFLVNASAGFYFRSGDVRTHLLPQQCRCDSDSPSITRAYFNDQVLRGFLERNVSRRLGAKKTTMFDIGGATAVKHHPFFDGIDWVKLIALQVEPPLKPDLVSTTDTSNFSSEFVDMALPRSLSQESLMSHASSLGPPCADEVEGMFRGFSFVADSFIVEDNWQCGDESGFSFTPAGTGEPDGKPQPAGMAFNASTPQKKVKGKRIRKKGRAKEIRAGAAEDAPVGDSAQLVGVDRTVLLPGAASKGDAAYVRGTSPPMPQPTKEVVAKEPMGGAESKPSGLAMMLAEQKQIPTASRPVPSGPRRPNVWGSSDLPAPAPVPTPAGPPRAHGRQTTESGASVPGRRVPVKGLESLPGRHSDGTTFVWKRPV